MVAATCPTRDMLLQYSIGTLSDEQSDDLAGHLDSCPDCQATIVTLEDAEDTLIGRLRTSLGSEACLAEPEFQAALAEAIAMPAAAPSSIGVSPVPPGDEGDSASAMPHMLGEYQILEELGRGGMGRVYKALHTKLDRVVAVKVLPRGRVEDRQAIARFEREMKAVGRLAHPNIVQAYDAREIDGTPVLIMEFVDGLDLAELVRRTGPLPVAEACELVRQTALGLQRAHEHGLVHRDIKPSNIMLTGMRVESGKRIADSGRDDARGETALRSPLSAFSSSLAPPQVKLLDLGLARFYAEASAGEEMTGTGQAMGTADYMAPEQASDSRTVDIRADIYSLGCTLYKLLSGRAPFSGPEHRGTLDKMNAHVHQTPPPVRQFAPGVPEELAAILERMLAKDPNDRFATPAEVAAAIEPFCTGASLPSLWETVRARDEQAESGPLSDSERAMVRADQVELSPLSLRERVRVRADQAPIPRRSTIKTILIGLAFLGAIAAAFAAGVLITINKSGERYQVEVPKDSHTVVDDSGNVTVDIPGQAKAAVGAVVPDEKAIQGTWEILSSTFSLLKKLPPYEKEIAPEEVLKTTKVVITADTLKIVGQLVTDFAFEYKLNPAAKTKMIDLQTPGPTFGMVSYGIYQLDGEQLKICTSGLRILGDESRRPDASVLRPSELWAEFGSGKELLVLRRVADAAVTEDEMAIQGAWRVEVGDDETRPLGFGRNELIRFSRHEMGSLPRGGEAVFPAGMGMSWHGWQLAYALDPTARPKRIDIATISCPFVQPVHGLYQLEGDRLTICWAATSAAGLDVLPPSKLAAGPNTVLNVLKRVTEGPDKGPSRDSASEKPAQQPAATPAVSPAAEFQALQGRWKVVRVEKGKDGDASWAKILGYDFGEENPATFDRLHFKENELTIKNFKDATGTEWDYRIDPTAAPKTIDLLKNGGVTGLGVYEIDGDRLTICLAKYLPSLKTNQRPKRLAVGPDSGDVLLVLQRYRLSADEKRIEGFWAVASQVDDGKPVPEEKLRRRSCQVFEDSMGVFGTTADGQPDNVLSGPYELDPTKHPKTIRIVTYYDYENKKFEKRELLGIYKFDGDRLTIAYRRGGPRPEKLESPPGSGVTLLVLQRREEPKAAVTPGAPPDVAREKQPPAAATQPPAKPAAEKAKLAQEPSYEGKTLSKWIALAKEKSPEQRIAAALALAHLGPPAVPTLAELLKDQDAHVRGAAAKTLGNMFRYNSGTAKQIGPEAKTALPALTELLKDQHSRVRLAAVDTLGEIGPEAKTAVPALTELLKDTDPVVRKITADRLGWIGPDAQTAVPALTELLNDKDSWVRVLAARTLANISPEVKTVVPALTEFLKDKNSGVRSYAAHALLIIGPEAKAAVPAVTELLKDEDPQVRSVAAQTLAMISPEAKTAVPALTNLLRDKDPQVRLQVAGRLGDMGPEAKAAVPALTELLKDEDSRVRQCAAQSLSRIRTGHEPTYGGTTLAQSIALAKRPGHPIWAVREAFRALGHFGPPAVPTLTEFLKDGDSYVRQRAARSLGCIGPEAKTAVPALTELLKDADWGVRTAAAYALGDIGPEAKTAVPALRELLNDTGLPKDTGWIVREAAAKALDKIKTERTAEPPPAQEQTCDGKTLSQWIGLAKDKDKDPVERRQAACALGSIGINIELRSREDSAGRWSAGGGMPPETTTVILALRELLKDQDSLARMFAAQSLRSVFSPNVRPPGLIGSEAKTVVPALTELLKDYDSRVRAEGARALRNLGPEAKTAVPPLAELLKDKESEVRLSAAETLAVLGTSREAKPAVPALTEFLKDKSYAVRLRTVQTLGRIGREAKSAVPAVTELLADADWRVQREAAEALGNIGPEARTSVPALTELLKDNNRNVRLSGAVSLGQIGPEAKSAVPALTELLKDKDSWVRCRAAEALGNVGPEAKTAVPALTELLSDEDSLMRLYAAAALARLSHEAKPAVPLLTEWLKDKNRDVRFVGARTLGLIGPEAETSVPALTELLKDAESGVRTAAAEALGKIGPGAKRAVPALTESLNDAELPKDTGWIIRETAAAALDKIKREERKD